MSQKVFDLLESSGTNWTAEKKPTFDAEGFPSEHYGVFRSDDRRAIGAVGERYTVLQNAELATTIIEAGDGFISDIRGGLFKNGKKVYYQGSMDDEHVGNDTIKRNLVALNSHDGSSSIGFGFSNTVISCQNTFYKAMKDIESFRHTASASERLEIAREEIKRTLQEETTLIDNYKRMADRPIGEKVKQQIVADLFNISVGDLAKSADDFSPAKVKSMTLFGKIFQQETAQKGNTLWGLFNAVTYKTNHLDAKENKSLEYVMLGAGNTKNLRAYNTIVASLPKLY